MAKTAQIKIPNNTEPLCTFADLFIRVREKPTKFITFAFCIVVHASNKKENKLITNFS